MIALALIFFGIPIGILAYALWECYEVSEEYDKDHNLPHP